MERLIISRGHHPNEATAFSLAPKVKSVLERRGYQVDLVDIPLTSTPFGKVITGENTTNKDWVRKTLRRTGADFVFSFHNSQFPNFKFPFFYEENTYFGKKRLILEIPAIYKPITNPLILAKVMKYVHRSENPGKPAREDLANMYMRVVVSVADSTQKGLMGKNMTNRIARIIDSYIKEKR